MKPPCSVGDRIMLVSMPDDPDPIMPGTRGTVLSMVNLWDSKWQIGVKWDTQRSLSLIWPVDQFVVLRETELERAG